MRSRRRQLNLQKIEIDLQTGAFDVYVRLREQDVTVPVNLSSVTGYDAVPVAVSVFAVNVTVPAFIAPDNAL